MSCLKGGNCEHGGCSDCQSEPNIKLGQDWLIKEGTNKTSSENIKTGLRLSEAIKLLEENDGALIKPDSSNDDFYAPFPWTMATLTNTYTVKLPPPKTVTVTRADVERAYNKTHPIFDNIDYNNSFYQFLKELGL